MTVYYAAVDGDPLTSEEGSYVIAQGQLGALRTKAVDCAAGQ
ncbi:hypothetical protein [Caballeronia sp. GACF4]|nr:hypothetical protein [Caballeronia sp. GACF4]